MTTVTMVMGEAEDTAEVEVEVEDEYEGVDAGLDAALDMATEVATEGIEVMEAEEIEVLQEPLDHHSM